MRTGSESRFIALESNLLAFSLPGPSAWGILYLHGKGSRYYLYLILFPLWADPTLNDMRGRSLRLANLGTGV